MRSSSSSSIHELENFTQRKPSQFERVEAHLQQQTKQELKQTSARDRDRNRDRDRDRDRELDREGEESEENVDEASTESLFEHQQKASNDENFYEVFQIWYVV